MSRRCCRLKKLAFPCSPAGCREADVSDFFPLCSQSCPQPGAVAMMPRPARSRYIFPSCMGGGALPRAAAAAAAVLRRGPPRGSAQQQQQQPQMSALCLRMSRCVLLSLICSCATSLPATFEGLPGVFKALPPTDSKAYLRLSEQARLRRGKRKQQRTFEWPHSDPAARALRCRRCLRPSHLKGRRGGARRPALPDQDQRRLPVPPLRAPLGVVHGPKLPRDRVRPPLACGGKLRRRRTRRAPLNAGVTAGERVGGEGVRERVGGTCTICSAVSRLRCPLHSDAPATRRRSGRRARRSPCSSGATRGASEPPSPAPQHPQSSGDATDTTHSFARPFERRRL